MINNLLGMLGLELKKKEQEYLKIDLPDIRFTTDNGTITESIIEYGENEDGKFYVLTDSNKLIYIDDEETQEMIHYGDSTHIVDISEDELETLKGGLNNG